MRTVAICPTYGRIPYLSRMLASFTNQTYDHKQLIIVNDDKNIELCCDRSDVLVVNITQRLSVSVKRNLAISLSDADIIFPLDDDDIFMPDRISNHVEHYEASDIDAYRNLASYIIYGDLFKKSDAAPHNAISYKKKQWDVIGGYITHKEPYEDVDIFNRFVDVKLERDETKKDFILGFGGVNYHYSCGPTQKDLEQLAYTQLKSMDLLYKKYWIEPDIEQYDICKKLADIYDQTKQDIKVRHIADAKLEIL